MGYSKFTKEFKTEAVTLLRESKKPVREIAATVGVTPKTLREWAAQINVDNGN